MAKKSKKFDLTHLVHAGYVKEGQPLYFVSDPSKTCVVTKHPSGEYKVSTDGKQLVTVHAFAQTCLGTEPPDHASKWLRTAENKTLYELWHAEEEESLAA
ncbi:MAG: hypothetical protein A2X94_15470 [Bdellovibrionales bacterium GWB1_55_8]|nr:MAG: hypothetical protein A2X94_15470 [Bdellovibrionales bacterium GWB1_55_8]